MKLNKNKKKNIRKLKNKIKDIYKKKYFLINRKNFIIKIKFIKFIKKF